MVGRERGHGDRPVCSLWSSRAHSPTLSLGSRLLPVTAAQPPDVPQSCSSSKASSLPCFSHFLVAEFLMIQASHLSFWGPGKEP